MGKSEVRCPNCGTSFVIGNGENVTTHLCDGISYLVPETIRNENKTAQRLDILKAAGVDVSKLQSLMQNNDELKDIFNSDDPIIEEITKGGFIRNPELFRRWICAQTFGLIKHPYGWTRAVRQRYDLRYVWRQTKNELALLCKLQRKCPDDKRFKFFTFEDLKAIFIDCMDSSMNTSTERYTYYRNRIVDAATYSALYDAVSNITLWFNRHNKHLPKRWLNCFKGAGAYYTLQNIIRTHGLIIPGCKDMNESLNSVEALFNKIVEYEPRKRRWDCMLSLLTMSVTKTDFELKY